MSRRSRLLLAPIATLLIVAYGIAPCNLARAFQLDAPRAVPLCCCEPVPATEGSAPIPDDERCPHCIRGDCLRRLLATGEGPELPAPAPASAPAHACPAGLCAAAGGPLPLWLSGPAAHALPPPVVSPCAVGLVLLIC